ncbi:hypothetical protein H072_4957 [Dactylellina haptotyla CBS 200.50]|uniref:Uncharacterized protein n=1 Tax=Dactylellina haptotyla (strain CBS 200.50) TaxID=1284197 RepID=S8C0L8_DACHA|nr:hypothetical protein H072_4957 [Dactylellina haptotyla CBS 200.50]
MYSKLVYSLVITSALQVSAAPLQFLDDASFNPSAIFDRFTASSGVIALPLSFGPETFSAAALRSGSAGVAGAGQVTEISGVTSQVTKISGAGGISCCENAAAVLKGNVACDPASCAAELTGVDAAGKNVTVTKMTSSITSGGQFETTEITFPGMTKDIKDVNATKEQLAALNQKITELEAAKAEMERLIAVGGVSTVDVPKTGFVPTDPTEFSTFFINFVQSYTRSYSFIVEYTGTIVTAAFSPATITHLDATTIDGFSNVVTRAVFVTADYKAFVAHFDGFEWAQPFVQALNAGFSAFTQAEDLVSSDQIAEITNSAGATKQITEFFSVEEVNAFFASSLKVANDAIILSEDIFALILEIFGVRRAETFIFSVTPFTAPVTPSAVA